MHVIARAKIRPECVDDVKAGVTKLFEAIEQAHPQGVRYSYSVLADGVTFLNQVELQDGIDDNPLAAIPAVREFAERVGHWLAEPVVREELTTIASYRSF